MSRTPGEVLAVVSALGAVFTTVLRYLVRREEQRGYAGVVPGTPKVKAPRATKVKEPRVRVRPPCDLSHRPDPAPEPIEEPVLATSEALPDPRRPSLVLNLEAFTEFRSRQ